MYRDYENPAILEQTLREWLKDHPKETWTEDDWLTQEDLRQRINFAWQDLYEEDYLNGRRRKFPLYFFVIIVYIVII